LPNPANGNKTILNIASAKAQGVRISITDISGKILLERKEKLISGSTQLALDISRLSGGVYNVSVSSDEGERKTTRLIKQ
jgi:hypothetical protein